VPAWLPASPLACLRSSHASRVSRAWLAFIRRCRILGLSLAEIHELQSYQDDPHQPCTAVNALLDDHISHVRSQITALQALEKQLVSLRASCNDDREVEACGVLAGISEGNMHQQ